MVLRQPVSAAWALSLIYGAAVVAHIAALAPGSRFPHLSTDEAQYVAVGENLRLGHGFTVRGYFHSGIPPVYPLFVAAAHAIGGPSRFTMLCWNSAAICLAIFPTFLLARYFGLSLLNSHLLATAAVFLPHTYFATLYMAENVHYPLALTGFYLSAKWLDAPSWRRDAVLGLTLGTALLDKWAEMSLLIALLATAVAVTVIKPAERRARWVHTLVVFSIVAAFELAWLGWKNMHGGSALGAYGENIHTAVRATMPYRLLLTYLGDFFLAPGLIVVVPLFFWLRENWRERRSLALLLTSTLACQIVIHSILEARLTDSLRERLFMYSLPLMGIAAVAGVDALKRRQQTSVFARYIWLPYVPLVLLALVGLTSFGNPPPAADAPWIGLLGSLNRIAFVNRELIEAAAVAILVGSTTLLLTPARPAATLLALGILGFNTACFASTAGKLALWSNLGLNAVQPVVDWLTSAGAKPGGRLFITAKPWVFEGPKPFEPMDQFMQEWIYDVGPYKLLSVQLEGLARYDIRTITRLEQIPEEMRTGDFLLTTTRFSGLRFVSQRFPYYLYSVTESSSPQPLYTTDIPAEKLENGAVAVPFVAGRFRFTPHVHLQPGSRLILNVLAEHKVIATFEGTSGQIDVPRPMDLSFTLTSQPPGATLDSLTAEFVSGEPRPVPAGSSQEFRPETRLVATNQMRATGSCQADSLNGVEPQPEYRVQRSDGLALFGSAYDEFKDSADAKVLVELISRNGRAYSAPAERVDHTGVRLHAKLDDVPPGPYRLTMIQQESDAIVQCNGYWNVIVE